MKIGLSSYSLHRAIAGGEMNICQAIEWCADNGGEHMEIVPSSFKANGNPALIEEIKKTAKAKKIDISSYTIGASFIQTEEAAYQAEIERVKTEVDTAAALGVKFMRHDIASRSIPDCTRVQFEKDLPQLVKACQIIADYAAKYGITTSIENHGYHIQNSERVRQILLAVNRPNFKTTVDVGNFLCVDEDPVSAVSENLPFASFFHFKDFYVRQRIGNADGWFQSAHGRFLRGAVTGNGDIDLWTVAKRIKSFGYDGYVSIEFEGWEECKDACKKALANVKGIFASC